MKWKIVGILSLPGCVDNFGKDHRGESVLKVVLYVDKMDLVLQPQDL